MKLTLRQVFNAHSVLYNLANQPMALRYSFRIGRILRILESDFRVIEKSRQDLVYKYGQETETSGNKKVTVTDPESIKQFNAEFQELLNEEVKVDLEPLAIEDLPPELKMSPGEMTVVDFLFRSKEDKCNYG